MSSSEYSYAYHIARRVGNQGARPPVRNQAGVFDKSTTGSSNSIDNHISNCQVVIEPIDFERLKNISSLNLQNLKLVESKEHDISTSSLKKCNVVVDVPPKFSDRFKSLSRPNANDNRKRCKVCHITVKGNRGLTIHLNRNPNCKRNVGAGKVVARCGCGGACAGLCCSTDCHDHVVVDALSQSLSRQVSESVKYPSTSVESLENLCQDGSVSKICKHPHKKNRTCQLCCVLSTNSQFVSSSTHRTYHSIIPDDVDKVDCKTENIIYLVTCRKCKLQYVGETVQLLRGRIGKHSNSIDHPYRDHHCRILVDHFSSGLCQGATFTVHVLEKLSGTGRDAEGNVDPAITRIRRQKERDWMLRLRTVFPYGLNDRVGDEYMPEKDLSVVCSRFPSLKRVKEQQKVRTKSSVTSTFLIDNFIYIINESLRTNLRNTMNLIRVLLSSLKKSSCRILFDRITDFLSTKHDSYRYFQFFSAALDIVKSKIGKPPSPRASNKSAPTNRCHISFNNKALDFININRILKSKDVVNTLPINLRSDSPTVVYQLTDTIRSKLFNYKEFVQSIDVDAFLADNSILPCDCDHSPFVNGHHGHVMSGDLNIIPDPKLRTLIAKGPKYREPLPFSCERAKEEILVGLDACINSWSTKSGVDKVAFGDWRNTIAEGIDRRILSLDNSKRKAPYHSILKSSSTSSCLSLLQSKYVMVPIDKAANNVAFICKRFYATVLMEELGLSNESSSTYTHIQDQTPDDIVSLHQKQLKDEFNIEIDEGMRTLPDIYWIPKLHKNPAKFRFIIASKHCTTKTVSKNLSSIFTLFLKHIDTYYTKAHFYSGIKSYWIINNRDSVLRAINKSRERKSAKCVSSFDFSTLYTKIPHDKLVDVLSKIIDFVFKGGTRNKISVNSFG